MRISAILPLLAALTGAATAQDSCTVNDPLSHGTLGDSKLSLEEAIRVMNKQLLRSQLSAAEDAQFVGNVNVLDTVHIDATITPVITLERELSFILGDNQAHADCNFYGVNGRPMLDATGRNTGFPSRTNHFHLRNFVVQGGKIGVEYNSSLHYHPGERMLVDNCLFVGQTQVGVQANIPSFPPGEIEPGDIRNTTFQGLPVAIELLDKGFSGVMDITGSSLTIAGCTIGILVNVEGFGGRCKAVFDRVDITGATTGVQLNRPGSDSTFDLQFVHSDIYATGSAFDVQGDVIGASQVQIHHSRLWAGPNASDYALRLSTATGRFDLLVGESEFHGNVLAQIGRLGQALRVHNSRFKNGAVTISNASTSATTDLKWNVFESSPVTVAATNTVAATVDSCEFVRSPVTELSTAGTTLTNCLLASSALTGNVTSLNAAPAQWIGSSTVTPEDPPIGGFVDLTVALQPNTAAAWLISLAVKNPITTAVPHRFYLDVTQLVPMPGVYRNQERLRLPIPNNLYLRGFEFYAQPVVVPTAGQGYVPPFSLPAGGRFAIQ